MVRTRSSEASWLTRLVKAVSHERLSATLSVAFAIRSRPITAKRLDVAFDVANIAVALFFRRRFRIAANQRPARLPPPLGLALVLSILSTGDYNLKFHDMTMGPKRHDVFQLEVEMRIALEVEKRPILWDSKSSLYKRSDLEPAVWEEVARVLGDAHSG